MNMYYGLLQIKAVEKKQHGPGEDEVIFMINPSGCC